MKKIIQFLISKGTVTVTWRKGGRGESTSYRVMVMRQAAELLKLTGRTVRQEVKQFDILEKSP